MRQIFDSRIANELLLALVVLLIPTVAQSGPNIILIVADDLGWGDLRKYGHRLILTPRLDQLAVEGTRFTQFYVNSTVCSPSRAAILTGRFPAELGIHHALSSHEKNQEYGNVDYLDPLIPNIANILSSGGYATAHIGKWHLTGGPYPSPDITEYGFDYAKVPANLVNPNDEFFRAKLPDALVDASIDYLGNHITVNPGTPFFLNLWFVTPHASLNPTAEQLAVYDHLATHGAPYEGAPKIYYAAVTAMDMAIGRLLDYLDAAGIADDTAIIFTSDNGPEGIYSASARHSGVGEPGPFRGRKRSLYEGGIRVPFFVRHPASVPAYRVVRDSVVSGVDLLPTILDLAQIAPPDDLALDGESFVDILAGANRETVRPLMWNWRFGDLDLVGAPQINKSPIVAMRSGPYKLLFNPAGLICDGREVSERVELYNIVDDPGETDNIASSNMYLTLFLLNQATYWHNSLPVGPCDRYAGQVNYNWP